MLKCCTSTPIDLGVITKFPFTTTYTVVDAGVYLFSWTANGRIFTPQMTFTAGQTLVINDGLFTNGGNLFQLIDSSGVVYECFNACVALSDDYYNDTPPQMEEIHLDCSTTPAPLPEKECVKHYVHGCGHCGVNLCNCHD